MALFADSICLMKPLIHRGIQPSRQYHVCIDPLTARRFTQKMILERISSAGMLLVAVGEDTRALTAPP
jgi:hypothetical protein